MCINNMEDVKVSTKRTIRNDIILIVSLLLIASIGILYLFVFRDKGDTVKITVNGENYGTYSLNQDQVIDICQGENNETQNRVIISKGKASMEYATCPDGICVDHAPIYRDGESIVCLPQKVVVTVITDKTDGPDIIT